MVVDSVTGEIKQQIKYSEFREVLQDTNPGFQPFGFAGGAAAILTGVATNVATSLTDATDILGKDLPQGHMDFSKKACQYMNNDVRTFGFCVGLMCITLSLIGLGVFNYMYFFQPERHGPNIETDILFLNFMGLAGVIIGWKLLKKFGKLSP